MVAAFQLHHALQQGFLVLVEPGRVLLLAAIFRYQIIMLNVPRERHPVTSILGEKFEPFVEAPLVQKFAFIGKKILDPFLKRRGERSVLPVAVVSCDHALVLHRPDRSEEHTSELQSLMRISYAVFCLKTKKKKSKKNNN